MKGYGVQINHRITARHDDPFWLDVDRLGLDYERGDPASFPVPGISILNVTEDQKQWPDVEKLLAESRSLGHTVSTSFSKSELDDAEWLLLNALGHHGYPQPEDGLAYRDATYDLSDYCATCGIGAKQNAPFRMRAEPKAAHSQFIQLNWVFDEFFIREEAIEGFRIAGMTGIDFMTPVLNRSGLPSECVRQMVITTTLAGALDTTGLQPVTCKPLNEENETLAPSRLSEAEERACCGRVKYHFRHAGVLRFDSDAFVDAPDVVKSHEWFGSGAAAFQLVIVSQRLRQTVIGNEWRGVSFEPVALVEASPNQSLDQTADRIQRRS